MEAPGVPESLQAGGGGSGPPCSPRPPAGVPGVGVSVP